MEKRFCPCKESGKEPFWSYLPFGGIFYSNKSGMVTYEEANIVVEIQSLIYTGVKHGCKEQLYKHLSSACLLSKTEF